MAIKKFLGQILSDMGFVTGYQLEEALHKQKQMNEEKKLQERMERFKLVSDARASTGAAKASMLGDILTDMGFVTEKQLREALKEQDKSIEGYRSLDNVKLGFAIEVGFLVNSTLNLAEVLNLIMENINRVTGSAASTLMLLDEKTGELVLSVPTGPNADKLTDIRLPPGVGIAGWVVEHEHSVLIPDAKEDSRFFSKIDKISGLETRSMLCVPLKAKSKLIGVIEVINKEDGTVFNEEDMLLLSIFGYQAAVAIENARLHGELKEQLEERKRAEGQRRELENRLRRAEKMEALGALAGGVAHDLNNILSGIVSYPELLLMQFPQDSPLRKSVKVIQESGKKAAAIVQDLLTLARRGVAVTDVVNLNDIISEYIQSPEFRRLKSYHPNVKVKSHMESDLLNILGSSVHLSKMVMNLISNGAEAMTAGGELCICTENLYIDKPIKCYEDVKEGDYVRLKVSDTGTGISSQDLDRIFEPFYTKKKMGRSGTGLGMAVVWGTIKDHNGYIDIQTKEGKGSTFTIFLPVTRKEIVKYQSPLSIEEYMGNGESILVVDDMEEQRAIAAGMLKRLGYCVKSVPGGEEAVDYMKENSVDLLILDMIMDPGIDGLETYKRILQVSPEQKAIITSGFSETDRVKEAKRLGAGAYVHKPYIFEKIGVAIKNELRK